MVTWPVIGCNVLSLVTPQQHRVRENNTSQADKRRTASRIWLEIFFLVLFFCFLIIFEKNKSSERISLKYSHTVLYEASCGRATARSTWDESVAGITSPLVIAGRLGERKTTPNTIQWTFVGWRTSDIGDRQRTMVSENENFTTLGSRAEHWTQNWVKICGYSIWWRAMLKISQTRAVEAEQINFRFHFFTSFRIPASHFHLKMTKLSASAQTWKLKRKKKTHKLKMGEADCKPNVI